MKNAALAFRPHSGWTALVAVCLHKGHPIVLRKDHVHLVETFRYKFRQPYHTAKTLPLDQAREFVSFVDSEARRLAAREIQKAQFELAEQGYRLAHCGLLMASGRTLPNLEAILAAHALIHSADGELFRDALAAASEHCAIPVFRIKEKEIFAHATKKLRLAEPALRRQLTELGRPLGAPWAQDEKVAALAAWLTLA